MTWTLTLRLEFGRKAPDVPSEPNGISDVPQPITVYVERPEPVVPPLGFDSRKAR